MLEHPSEQLHFNMAAVAVTAAVSTAASISTTIVAEAELSPSISQQSSGFTDPPPDNTFVTTCHKCGEQVVESVVDMISKLQSGRLHIHCQTLHCNTIVCHSSSLFSNAVYSNAPAADTVRCSRHGGGKVGIVMQLTWR